jgi:glutamate dehydrogenase
MTPSRRGSAGYDHKKMGITARGAWEAVKRHFREMDIDIQTTPFTAAGVGDMSGDVFGNGMLLSTQIRLLAAFDHRDIFIDPDPDCAIGFAERSGCSISAGRAGRTTTSPSSPRAA